MSVNVILNNVVYNGIETLKLPLADGSGFASFAYNGGTPSPSGPMYTMGDGSYTATYGSKVTVNGNHVRFETAASYANTTYGIGYNSVKKQIGEQVYNQPDPIANIFNNNVYWFTIPAGRVVLNISNIVGLLDNQDQYRFNLVVGIRGVGGSANVITTGTIGSGGTDHKEITLNAAQDAGAVVLYLSAPTDQSLSANAVVEFDVELSVDGVRYI